MKKEKIDFFYNDINVIAIRVEMFGYYFLGHRKLYHL